MPRGVRAETREETGRRRRFKVGGRRLKLTVPDKDPAFEYRWVNDEPGRIAELKEAGWAFADPEAHPGVGEDTAGNTDKGSHISRHAGTFKNGEAKRSYLMRIPKEYYAEDQADKQKELDEVDAAIRRGHAHDQSADHQYIPKSGITYNRK